MANRLIHIDERLRLTPAEYVAACEFVERISQGVDTMTQTFLAKVTGRGTATITRVKNVLRLVGVLLWASRHKIIPGSPVTARNAACRYWLTLPAKLSVPERPWLRALAIRVADRVGRTPKSAAIKARLTTEVAEAKRTIDQISAELRAHPKITASAGGSFVAVGCAGWIV